MSSVDRKPRTTSTLRRSAALALAIVAGVGVSSAGTAVADETSAGVMAVGSRLINGDGDTSGECLEISSGGTGTRVQMARCHTNAHQSWYFIQLGGGWVQIRSHDTDANGKCLTARGEGNQVVMQSCTGNDAQDWWTGRPASPGWFQLNNPAYLGYQCLDVKDNGLNDIVQTWQCGPSNKGNQLWRWHSVG